jgi:signal transduction histidine kinase/ligand-binding sensor domain-containing protein
MQRNTFFLACLFIPIAIVRTTAIAQQYPFASFTIEEGLSNNVVYATHQDSKGFLWIATHDGLNRYDGYEFKKFLHNPFDKKTLASNMAIDMAEDENGMLWVLTNTHLHLYNEKYASFDRFMLPSGTGVNHGNQSASKLINASGRFLLLNLFNGLFAFDKMSKQFKSLVLDAGISEVAFKKISPGSDEKPDLFNFPFFKDKEGHVLIGAGNAKGVLAFDSATMTLQRKLPAFYQQIKWQNDIVTSICRTKKNKLIYCIQEGNKFFLVAPTGKKHLLLERSVTGITFFIESMEEDEQGDIWLGYGNRLFEYLPDSDTVLDLSQNLYITPAGTNFIIKSICIDNFSNLWVGLYEKGVLKASIRKSLFLNFAINRPGDLNLPHSSVSSIIKNPDETIIIRYFGTEMASLIDVANKKIITPEFKFDPLDSVALKKMFPQFQQISSAIPFYKLFDASARFTFNNGQFGLYKDRHQDYWAVNFNEFKRVKDGLTYNLGSHINCFHEGDDSSFWIGTEGSGLLQLNYRTGLLKKYLPDETNAHSISSQYVEGVVPNEKKGLWLATRFGLNYFDFHTGQFKLFSEEDGLCNNTIYTIENDKEGKLWLGTSHGLSCYDPRTYDFTNYSKNNGLVNSEYNRSGTIALSNGWIVMGGTEGIDVIMPDSIKYRRATEKKITPLVITSFKSPDSLFYSFTDPIRLSHRQNNLSISFAALDFTQPTNNKYIWKLEPVDKHWSYARGKREVNYAGLPPGNYTFKIKAAGADGIWNKKETFLSFVIMAPWWNSWWAQAAIILVSIALIAGVLRLYYHRQLKQQLKEQKILLEKQQAIEKERTRIATDMHDDLGAGLSRIKFLSETIGIKKQKQESIEDEISSIRNYTHEMIDKMGEIVWALNEKNDSLFDLLAYARAYAVEYLTQNGIRCTVKATDDFPATFVSGEFRRNIYLAVKEALHNIVKHAGAEHVFITFDVKQELQIIIKDDGCGFEANHTKPFRNGLINMRKRMKDLGGSFEIKNLDGTQIYLSAPLPL